MGLAKDSCAIYGVNANGKPAQSRDPRLFVTDVY